MTDLRPMRILYSALFALAFAAPLASPVHAQLSPPPNRRPSATQPPAAAATPSQPATASKPAQKTATVEPTKPKVWEPAVIHAETDDADADSDGMATVNDEFAFSDYELRQRWHLFLATSGIQPQRRGTQAHPHPDPAPSCEDEKLELNEAMKKHITVSPVEVDKRSQPHARRKIISPSSSCAKSSAMPAPARMRCGPSSPPSSPGRRRCSRNMATDQHHAGTGGCRTGALCRRRRQAALSGERDLPAGGQSRQDAKVLKDAQEVEAQLQTGRALPPWSRISSARSPPRRQAAISAGSMKASWRRNSTPRLTKMAVDTISPPIRSIGGYYILALRERQEPLGTKIADVPRTNAISTDSTLPLARLLLPLGAGTTKEHGGQRHEACAPISAAASTAATGFQELPRR